MVFVSSRVATPTSITTLGRRESMKLLRVTVLLLSLVAFAFSTPGHAAASGSATVFHLHQLAALAGFDSFSPDGCVETFVFVAGLQNNGVPEAFGFIGQFDNCADTLLLSAAGETFNTTFQINNQLTSASLSAI